MAKKPKNQYTREQLMQMLDETTRKEAAEQAREAALAAHRITTSKFVEAAICEALHLQEALRQFKWETLPRAIAMNDELFEISGVTVTEDNRPNQFEIMNLEGDMKVVVDKQTTMKFDNTASVAVAKIKEILQRTVKPKFADVYTLIEKMLTRTRTGEFDPKLLAKLNGIQRDGVISDKEMQKDFTEALAMLSKSLYVAESKTYIRFYKAKKDAEGGWEAISLQFSQLDYESDPSQ